MESGRLAERQPTELLGNKQSGVANQQLRERGRAAQRVSAQQTRHIQQPQGATSQKQSNQTAE